MPPKKKIVIKKKTTESMEKPKKKKKIIIKKKVEPKKKKKIIIKKKVEPKRKPLSKIGELISEERALKLYKSGKPLPKVLDGDHLFSHSVNEQDGLILGGMPTKEHPGIGYYNKNNFYSIELLGGKYFGEPGIRLAIYDKYAHLDQPGFYRETPRSIKKSDFYK